MLFSAHSFGASYLMITDLGSSAEMIRRGNVEGFSKGSNAIFENPAGLHHINIISTSVFASQIMQEVNYRNISLHLIQERVYSRLVTWTQVLITFH